MNTTLAEIDAALAATPPDSKERAELMRARFRALDQVEAEKRRAAAYPPMDRWPFRPGFVTLAAPGGFTHVELVGTGPRVLKSVTVVTRAGQSVEQTVTNEPVRVSVEVIDGHRYVFLDAVNASRILTGPQSGAWRELNGDPGAHPHFPETMFRRNNGAPI
jgi:hypothetical protein